MNHSPKCHAPFGAFVLRRWEDDKLHLVCEFYEDERLSTINRLLEFYDQADLLDCFPGTVARIVDQLKEIRSNEGRIPDGLWPEVLKKIKQKSASLGAA